MILRELEMAGIPWGLEYSAWNCCCCHYYRFGSNNIKVKKKKLMRDEHDKSNVCKLWLNVYDVCCLCDSRLASKLRLQLFFIFFFSPSVAAEVCCMCICGLLNKIEHK